MTHSDKLKTRFMRKIKVDTETGCWEWQAARIKGKGLPYGTFTVNGEKKSAHRVSYEMHVGPIPKGMMVRHKCDNPGCVNPGHLHTGTHVDNMQDMVDRNRQARGDRQGSSKLNTEQVLEMHRLRNEERMGQQAIASRFGVTQAMVGRIVNGKRWRTEYMHYHSNFKDGKGGRHEEFIASKVTSPINEDVARQIHKLYSDGVSGMMIADKFGVAFQTVYKIIKGASWPQIYREFNS